MIVKSLNALGNNRNENTHLEHIAIEGFKSIKKLDLKMKPINILIGANGAGKKNLFHYLVFSINYHKAIHGPEIAFQIGLTAIRSVCEGFDGWISRIELLGN